MIHIYLYTISIFKWLDRCVYNLWMIRDTFELELYVILLEESFYRFAGI